MEEVKRQILFVEGYTDLNFVKSFVGIHGSRWNEDVTISPAFGYEKAINNFCGALSNPSAYSRVGLIVDADNVCADRYKLIQDTLNTIISDPLTLPSLPITGLIATYYGMRYGIWIMPNCQGKGALESFLYNKISRPNSLLNEVETAINTLEEHASHDIGLEEKIYNLNHKKKAIVHTYMSWKEPPDYSLGKALEENFFEKETTEEKHFLNWLRGLYDL